MHITALTILLSIIVPLALSTPPTTEGYAPFTIPSTSQPAETYYKIIGDLTPSSRPFIALHGGPGVVSPYLEILSDITDGHHPHHRRWTPRNPLIVYDQIGNGKSTHFPETLGNTTFWTEDLFLAELDNLITHLEIQEYDLLGHSWGGMLAARHAVVSQRKGLKHLVLMSTPASMPLWIQAMGELRAALPTKVREVLDRHEKDGTTDSQEYQDAVMFFYSRHLITLDPIPPAIAEGFEWIGRDPTVYLTMNGPNEFYVNGSLKTWSIIDDIHKIRVPTLVTNGAQDEATDLVVAPFVEKLPSVKRAKFYNSSHMAHYEERDLFMRTVGGFLYGN